jgi:hypothetical protein
MSVRSVTQLLRLSSEVLRRFAITAPFRDLSEGGAHDNLKPRDPDRERSIPRRHEPPVKSRFEMVIAAKEHEMHHRGQLMVVERMLGITPHLTRYAEERIAAMRAAQGKG